MIPSCGVLVWSTGSFANMHYPCAPKAASAARVLSKAKVERAFCDATTCMLLTDGALPSVQHPHHPKEHKHEQVQNQPRVVVRGHFRALRACHQGRAVGGLGAALLTVMPLRTWNLQMLRQMLQHTTRNGIHLSNA